MPTFHTTSPDQLRECAQELVSVVLRTRSPWVIALHGDLGAGKTALVQALGKFLGVSDHVTSPTFVLMKSYTTHHPHISELTHIDAYRIEDLSEAGILRLPEIFKGTERLTCIEWPERLPGLIPENALHVTITIQGENERTITYGT